MRGSAWFTVEHLKFFGLYFVSIAYSTSTSNARLRTLSALSRRKCSSDSLTHYLLVNNARRWGSLLTRLNFRHKFSHTVINYLLSIRRKDIASQIHTSTLSLVGAQIGRHFRLGTCSSVLSLFLSHAYPPTDNLYQYIHTDRCKKEASVSWPRREKTIQKNIAKTSG
jgi:hypothetical protein